MHQFVETNGIRLAYIDHPARDDTAETLILMHGLTANANFFDGLVHNGLNKRLRVIAVDLRGRGRSDKPATGYTQMDHMGDLLGLLDALGLESAVVGGHSFGGLVTMYTAAHHPERITKQVILDSGLLHPNVREIIRPSVARLANVYDSDEVFLGAIRGAPYFNAGAWWHPDMESYYRADVVIADDGTVRHRSAAAAIEEAAVTGLDVDWETIIPQATPPAVVYHASEPFVPGGDPVLLEKDAYRTADLLPNGHYEHVPGHHLTMCFGENAAILAERITAFVLS